MEATTIIINDAPYGIEKPWNALRLAKALIVKKQKVNIFLLGDGVGLVKKNQQTPAGYYNLGQMLEELIKMGAEVRACRTCLDSRGITADEMIAGAAVGGTMTYLADQIAAGSRVITF